MKIDKIRVTCGKCKTVFDAEVVADCPIDVALASMRAVRCKCGSSSCGLGGNYEDAPPVSAPLADRVAGWGSRGEHGTSSKTIFSAFCGGMPKDVCVPLDPDDFRRCKLLLDLIPEWRSNLNQVSANYPWFAPMISQWDEIERLYNADVAVNPNSVPQCHAFMRPLVDACEKIMWGK